VLRGKTTISGGIYRRCHRIIEGKIVGPFENPVSPTIRKFEPGFAGTVERSKAKSEERVDMLDHLLRRPGLRRNEFFDDLAVAVNQ